MVTSCNLTVSKTRSGACRTITEALSACPAHSSTKINIHVDEGVYVERVVVPNELTNIVLVGDVAEKTTITNNIHAPVPTHKTATFSVFGDGFVAKNITFENSAGPDGGQAVALLNEADRCAYYKCSFKGYQDTLYAKKGRQFFRECDIYGAIDFVFGDDGSAIFQKCKMYALPSNIVYFTAQAKDTATSSGGFVFQNSDFKPAPGEESELSKPVAYLGRPWSNYSTVVTMKCYLGPIINQLGWAEWPPRTTNLVSYMEYKNWGPGANTTNRVDWKGYHVLERPEEVVKYSVREFIQGDTWIPKEIPYTVN